MTEMGLLTKWNSLKGRIRLWQSARQNLRSLLGNTAVVLLSNGIFKASNAILFIVMTHSLGKTAAGNFSIATTWVAITLNLALFGLDEILVREAAGLSDVKRLFANLLLVRIALTVVFALALGFFLVGTGIYSADLTLLIVFFAVGTIGDGIFLLCQALFMSQGLVNHVFLTTAVIGGLRLVLGVGLLVLKAGLVPLVLLFVFTSTAGAVFAVWLAIQRVLLTSLSGLVRQIDIQYVRRLLAQSSSFFWIGLFVMAEFQGDVLLLSVFKSAAEVAVYSSAQTLIIGAWIVPQAYRAVIYPRMAKAAKESAAKSWHFFKVSTGLSLVLGALFSGGLALFARFLIGLLYPKGFEISAVILEIFCLPLLFAFLSAPSSRMLLTVHKENTAAILMGISMAINILANLILIPPFGPLGAVGARVLSSGAFCMLSYVVLLRLRCLGNDQTTQDQGGYLGTRLE